MGIDRTGQIVYNESMGNSKITRENVRMIGIPVDLHIRIKDIAERDGEPMYKIVALAIDTYEWYKAAPTIPTVKDTTDARS